MSSRAGWYCIALGVFALGFINNPDVRATANQYVQVAKDFSCQVTEHVEKLAMASSNEPTFDIQTQVALNDVQARVACARFKVVQQRAVLANRMHKLQVMRFNSVQQPVINMPRFNVKVEPRCPQLRQTRDRI